MATEPSPPCSEPGSRDLRTAGATFAAHFWLAAAASHATMRERQNRAADDSMTSGRECYVRRSPAPS